MKTAPCATGSASAVYRQVQTLRHRQGQRHTVQLCFCAAILFLGAKQAQAEKRVATADVIAETPISQSDRDHWAFRRLIAPPIPNVTTTQWPATRVDNFILARLEQDDFVPLSPADRVTLIRRMSFDLRGLPPSPDEVDEFVGDISPDAVDRLADRYLASPQYGQHWGQHWLDLARFAETDGFEHDKVRLEAWRYRDWVIDALNDDMPYDRFIALQLAGDELEPDSEQATIATAFCLSGPDMPDINSMDERKHNLLNEITATVGSTLLGLQMGCVQCHDHKYDPISQGDFYRMRAIFEPAIELTKDKSVSVLSESSAKTKPSYFMIRGDWQRKGPAVTADVPRIAKSSSETFAPVKIENKSSGRRAALAKWITQPDHVLTTRVIANRVWQFHFGNGLSRSPSDFGIIGYEPSHPELLDYLATELVRHDWSLKTIHKQIVTSMTFGLASRAMLSVDEQRLTTLRAADPNNRLLARFSRQRLNGESIRDAMLSAAGVLNTLRGGPGVYPPLPAELENTLLRGQWPETANKSEHDRQSIYIFARRNLRYPIFEAFDRPDGNASCPCRNRSTTAPQSLLMLNSEFSLLTARRLAGSILAQADGDVDQLITRTFRATLCRNPSAVEHESSKKFLAQQTDLLRNEKRSADDLALPIPMSSSIDSLSAAVLTDLCLALFNSNEFIYTD